jgi:hypothetical protein
VVPQAVLAYLWSQKVTTMTFDIAHLNRTIFAAGGYAIALSAELDYRGSAGLECSASMPPLPTGTCPLGGD